MASDWLTDLHHANFFKFFITKLTRLEPMNVPQFPSFSLPNPCSYICKMIAFNVAKEGNVLTFFYPAFDVFSLHRRTPLWADEKNHAVLKYQERCLCLSHPKLNLNISKRDFFPQNIVTLRWHLRIFFYCSFC